MRLFYQKSIYLSIYLSCLSTQAEFFHSLGLDPGGAVAKEELLALELSPDYRHECGICDRDYMLRRGCPCCRD